ncbi:MAG: hypothetical protein MJ154_01185 [Candidatus Saccharibacteria bacterium]|nr:hypothetical protein [Candidatus Saccharibacteria bacterium]
MNEDGKSNGFGGADFSTQNNPAQYGSSGEPIRAAITSSGIDPDNEKGAKAPRSRLGFAGRKYNNVPKPQESTTFDGAPEYFKKAVNDNAPVVINNKKDKKPFFIIGGIAAVAVVLIAVVFINILSSNSSKLSASFSEKFYSFAQYFLYETESKEAPKKKESISDTYSIYTKRRSDNEYYDKLKQKYEDFYSEYKEGGNQYLDEVMLDYNRYFWLVYNNRNVSPLARATIGDYYIENGHDKTVEYIDNYYKENFKGDNDFIEALKGIYKSRDYLYVEKYDMYAQSSCIDIHTNDPKTYYETHNECMAAKATDDARAELAKNEEEYENIASSADTYLDYGYTFMEDYIWKIKELIEKQK